MLVLVPVPVLVRQPTAQLTAWTLLCPLAVAWQRPAPHHLEVPRQQMTSLWQCQQQRLWMAPAPTLHVLLQPPARRKQSACVRVWQTIVLVMNLRRLNCAGRRGRHGDSHR